MTERKLPERNERLILGIDPGFGRMGYAVVAAASNDLRLLGCDAIMTPTGQAYPLRLQLIYEELSVIIDRYCPQEAAIEKLFFGKNVTTAIGVAQARGVALLTLVSFYPWSCRFILPWFCRELSLRKKSVQCIFGFSGHGQP